MIKFATCHKGHVIARDFTRALDLGLNINEGWYHVKTADLAAHTDDDRVTVPHIKPGFAMSSTGSLYALAPDVAIGTGLSRAERIYEMALEATEAEL